MTESHLAERLAFMRMTDQSRDALRQSRAIIAQALPEALDRFYDQVRVTPATRRQFRDDQHIAGAKTAQLRHWDRIATGEMSEDYAASVRRIGEVHARLDVEPQWYIGGYALVLEHLVGAAIRAAWPKGMLGRKGGADAAAAQVGAMIKATLLDMDLVLDVYFRASREQQARHERERAEAAEAQAQVVAALATALSGLAQGDLTTRIDAPMPGDYATLREDFNSALAQLESTIAAAAEAARSMTGTVSTLERSGAELARRTEGQAASLEETAAAVEELSAAVKTSAASARETALAVADARHEAETSAPVVEQAIAAMSQIEASSSQIGQIIGVIDEIAFQTNLLALNAGVEAARAGDAGKGFAVVASEVRALAQRSAEAAKEIKDLIARSANQVAAGVDLVGQTGEALKKIVGRVSVVHGQVSHISASTEEQASGLSQVTTAVSEIDRVTQQNAAMVNETAASSADLAQEAQRLMALIDSFSLSSSGPALTGPSRRRAA